MERSVRPWVAVLLSSACTGLGQMHCGRMRRGTAFFLLSLLVAPVASLAAAAPPSRGALVTLAAAVAVGGAIFLAGIVDAWLLARRMKGAPPPAPGPGAALTAMFLAVGLLFPLGTAFFLRATAVEAFRIASGSMEPTLLAGDRVLVDKHAGQRIPERGEVVVFRAPDSRQNYVKRVVAVGGDRVEVRGGDVYVNGRALPREPAPEGGEGAWWETNGARRYRILDAAPAGERPTVPETTVPVGAVWVLGDHRGASKDSVEFGAIRRDAIVGPVAYVYWPASSWSRFGPLE